MATSKKKRVPARKKARKAPAKRKTYTLRSSSSNVASDAKKYGFRKKKPAKPASKTIASLEKYIKAVEAWKREQSFAAHNYKKLQGLKAKAAKL